MGHTGAKTAGIRMTKISKALAYDVFAGAYIPRNIWRHR